MSRSSSDFSTSSVVSVLIPFWIESALAIAFRLRLLNQARLGEGEEWLYGSVIAMLFLSPVEIRWIRFSRRKAPRQSSRATSAATQ